MNKLISVFFNTSMSNGHNGLYKIAKDDAEKGYCVFVNRNWTALKMITPNNVLLHYKAKKSTDRINMETIKFLPYCVSGTELNYSKALEAAVTAQYSRWEKRND